MSTGLPFIFFEGGDDTVLWLFPVEGALSGWLGDHYDLTISANNSGMLGMEGNGVFISNASVRLGLLHGFQIGAESIIQEAGDGIMGIGGSGGLFLQTTPGVNANFFMGAKYAMNAFFETGNPTLKDFSFHHAVWGVGVSANSGRLQITPEVIFDAAFLIDDSEFYSLSIIPSVTVSAAY